MAIPLNDTELVRLLQVTPSFRDQVILALECFCSLRHGEVALLFFGDVLEPNKTMKPFLPVYKPSMKRSQVCRFQPVPVEVRLLLRNYVLSCCDYNFGMPLFPSSHSKGEGLSAAHIGRLVRACFDCAGLPHVNPGHSLRATFWKNFNRSTRLLNDGWSDMIFSRVSHENHGPFLPNIQ